MRNYSIVVVGILAMAGCNQTHVAHSVAVGDSCNYDSDCAPPADDASNGVVTCACGACEESYQLSLECGSDARICSADETCAFLADGTGGCMPSARAGESCALVNCVPGLFCAPDAVCAASAGIGQACEPTTEDSCAAPAFCAGTSHTCAAPGQTGAACDSSRYERSECVDGDGCSLVSNTCVEQRDNGAACTDDAGCRSQYCTPGGTCDTRECDGDSL